MPCRSDYPDIDYEAQNRKRELDKVTRLLCGLCKNVESQGGNVGDFDSELAVWWKEHQEADRKREAKEAAEKARQIESLERDLLVTKRKLKRLKG